MKRRGVLKRSSTVPKDAVLLIPESEQKQEPAPYGIKPGYYDAKDVLKLLDHNKGNADAIQFIADMLETGDSENDGFATMLRENRSDPNALARIVEEAAK